jgi:hypothetical protein
LWIRQAGISRNLQKARLGAVGKVKVEVFDWFSTVRARKQRRGEGIAANFQFSEETIVG